MYFATTAVTNDSLLTEYTQTPPASLCHLTSRPARTNPSGHWLSDVLCEHHSRLWSAERKWGKLKDPTDLCLYHSLLSSFTNDVSSSKTLWHSATTLMNARWCHRWQPRCEALQLFYCFCYFVLVYVYQIQSVSPEMNCWTFGWPHHTIFYQSLAILMFCWTFKLVEQQSYSNAGHSSSSNMAALELRSKYPSGKSLLSTQQNGRNPHPLSEK